MVYFLLYFSEEYKGKVVRIVTKLIIYSLSYFAQKKLVVIIDIVIVITIINIIKFSMLVTATDEA